MCTCVSPKPMTPKSTWFVHADSRRNMVKLTEWSTARICSSSLRFDIRRTAVEFILSSCSSVVCVCAFFFCHTFLIVPSLLLHLNSPHSSSATPPAPQALQQAPPKRWSRSSFRATCAQQSAQSPAPCKQSTSAFSRIVWIGDETLGALLTLENKREERKKQRGKNTSHFNWRELWWNGRVRKTEISYPTSIMYFERV